MTYKIILFVGFLVFGVSRAIVSIKGAWLPHTGWEVTCSWQTMANDSLQSVRLYRNEHQYVVFRPEVNGNSLLEEIPSPGFVMRIDCRMSTGGQRGRCVTSLKPREPVTEDVYACEISGERPTFLQERSAFDAYVAPSNALVLRSMEGQSEVQNCTASGIPPPRLVWTVDGRKIPEDFTTSSWSSDTKLWHSWSTYRPHNSLLATCQPEVVTRSGQLIKGLQAVAVESRAQTISTPTAVIISGILLLFL